MKLAAGIIATIATITLVALTAMPLPVAAAAAAGAEEARREFERGVALLEDAKFAEASRALERSLALGESPSARYNLALAYRGLGAYRRAKREIERFFQLAAPAHEHLRAGALRISRELDATLVRLTVEVSGAPDALSIDGEPLALTASSTSVVIEVDPGVHTLETSKAGHAAIRVQTGELSSGAPARITIDAAGEPLPAQLTISTNVESAQIFVDDSLRGRGVVSLELRAGRYAVRAGAEGFEEKTAEVELRPGEQEKLQLDLSEREVNTLEAWWFWAAIGAVVAGSAAAAVVLARPGDPSYDGGSLGDVLRN